MTPAMRAVGRHDASPVAVAGPAATMAGWDAALALSYERRGQRTVLAKNEHTGPLVVQKSLYPEGDAICHTVILHPPGGIAGGDHLAIDIEAGTGTEILLTTPGATKWYKANSRQASQGTHLRAAANAIVEWLPLETIVFDGADAHSSLTVDLDEGARAAGWDVVAFGRRAAGERFTQGRFRQSIEIRRSGILLWAEYGAIGGGDDLLSSPAGYAGRTVSGLLWVCGSVIDDAAIAACREAVRTLPERTLAGVTCLPGGLLLARCLCDSTEQARRYLLQVWSLLRPMYAGRVAAAPRLWAT
jgi:urease accessory protein